jgi:hypothetical protein
MGRGGGQQLIRPEPPGIRVVLTLWKRAQIPIKEHAMATIHLHQARNYQPKQVQS